MKRLPMILGVSGVVLLAALLVVGARMSSPVSSPTSSEGDQASKGEPAHNNEGTPPNASGSAAMSSAVPSEKNRAMLKNNMHLITITTNLGVIKFKTYDADAPKTVENFLTLADKKFYEGVIFHRVIKGFMIQGGDPTGTGSGGPGYSFADELNPTTESGKMGYRRGVVAMANSGKNTNGSQFFIMLADTPLPHNYTIFGHVVEGQEVVEKIGATPTDSGDRPLTAITMQSVRAVVAE